MTRIFFYFIKEWTIVEKTSTFIYYVKHIRYFHLDKRNCLIIFCNCSFADTIGVSTSTVQRICRFVKTLSERTTRPSHNHSGPRPALPSSSPLSHAADLSHFRFTFEPVHVSFSLSPEKPPSRSYNLRVPVSSSVQTTRGACPSATRRDFGVPRDRRRAMTRRATSSGRKGRSPRRFTRRSGDVRISLSLSLPRIRREMHVRAMQRERRQREKEDRDRIERNLARWTYAQDEDLLVWFKQRRTKNEERQREKER